MQILFSCLSNPVFLNMKLNILANFFRLNFLSINRFERKKNIALAISAFSILCKDEENVLRGLNLADATLTIVGESLINYSLRSDIITNYLICDLFILSVQFTLAPFFRVAAYKFYACSIIRGVKEIG